jgi:hypothetical protein
MIGFSHCSTTIRSLSLSQGHQPCSGKQREHFRYRLTHSKTTHVLTNNYNLLTSLIQVHVSDFTSVRELTFYVLFYQESNTGFTVFSVTTNSRLQTDAFRKFPHLIPSQNTPLINFLTYAWALICLNLNFNVVRILNPPIKYLY